MKTFVAVAYNSGLRAGIGHVTLVSSPAATQPAQKSQIGAACSQLKTVAGTLLVGEDFIAVRLDSRQADGRPAPEFALIAGIHPRLLQEAGIAQVEGRLRELFSMKSTLVAALGQQDGTGTGSGSLSDTTVHSAALEQWCRTAFQPVVAWPEPEVVAPQADGDAKIGMRRLSALVAILILAAVVIKTGVGKLPRQAPPQPLSTTTSLNAGSSQGAPADPSAGPTKVVASVPAPSTESKSRKEEEADLKVLNAITNCAKDLCSELDKLRPAGVAALEPLALEPLSKLVGSLKPGIGEGQEGVNRLSKQLGDLITKQAKAVLMGGPMVPQQDAEDFIARAKKLKSQFGGIVDTLKDRGISAPQKKLGEVIGDALFQRVTKWTSLINLAEINRGSGVSEPVRALLEIRKWDQIDRILFPPTTYKDMSAEEVADLDKTTPEGKLLSLLEAANKAFGPNATIAIRPRTFGGTMFQTQKMQSLEAFEKGFDYESQGVLDWFWGMIGKGPKPIIPGKLDSIAEGKIKLLLATYGTGRSQEIWETEDPAFVSAFKTFVEAVRLTRQPSSESSQSIQQLRGDVLRPSQP